MQNTPAGSVGSISTKEAPGTTIVRLEGEVDAALRGEASHAMRVTLQRQLPVVLDTSALTFIDSTGLAFLIQCCAANHASGLPVEIVNPPEHLTVLLDFAGASHLFTDG